ncbi:hypothetical protein [Agarilytica rhodophyticola]|uniref:hypothetical protein n=1 Tax=Agarilytica rhodophyticola TaxID=1737490 RepID=UPI000B344735|nr:hypothetical protein [Agarilytica rhodophyticola]
MTDKYRLNINTLPENLVAFNTSLIKNTKTVWIDKKQISKLNPSLANDKEFLENFSFGIPSDFISADLFDNKYKKKLYADRYGSDLGGNGGSARCGYLDNFHLKGVGKTPLSGAEDTWHSYGGFSLVEAMCEIIYSKIFEKIMPRGVVSCFGIIFTGEKTALRPTFEGERNNIRGKGCILVRSSSIRPAHLIPNQSYTAQRDDYLWLFKDTYRVRTINQKINLLLGGRKNYIKFIGNFLSSCADQFSFSFINRIYHGAINASNIEISGKWLDLTTATFVSHSFNYQNRENMYAFNDERDAILHIAGEVLHQYDKYNNLFSNKSILECYYMSQYKAYFRANLITAIGLPKKCYNILKENIDYRLFSDIVKNLIENKKTKRNTLKISISCDPLFHYINTLYLDLLFNRCKIQAFQKTVNLSKSISKIKNYNCFIKSCIIRLYRRTLLTPIYYRENIIKQLLLYEHKIFDRHSYSSFIEEFISTTEWIFREDECTKTTIIKTKKIAIDYDAIADNYVLYIFEKSEKIIIDFFSDMFYFVSKYDSEVVVCGFSCISFLNEIKSTFCNIERG